MLAIDLSLLPTWTTYDRRSKLAVLRHIAVYAHQDAKLKGFGAATKLLRQAHPLLTDSSSASSPASQQVATVNGDCDVAHYRLICGRGIKNMHIWSVVADYRPVRSTEADSSESADSGPMRWTLLFDVPTNGMTIELIGFRHNGNMAFSRSKGYGLRLWDLTRNAHITEKALHAIDGHSRTTFPGSLRSSDKEIPSEIQSSESTTMAVAGLTADGSATSNAIVLRDAFSPKVAGVPCSMEVAEPSAVVHKLSHQEVPYSQDVMSVVGGFAFGGEYQLSLLNLADETPEGCPSDATSSSSLSAAFGSSSTTSSTSVNGSWNPFVWRSPSGAHRTEVALPEMHADDIRNQQEAGGGNSSWSSGSSSSRRRVVRMLHRVL